MKKLLTLTLISLAFSAYAVETKKVCHEKNGKQVCKIVKVHKAISDATKVPEKKKK